MFFLSPPSFFNYITYFNYINFLLNNINSKIALHLQFEKLKKTFYEICSVMYKR